MSCAISGDEEDEEDETERKLKSEYCAILARREHMSRSTRPQDSAQAGEDFAPGPVENTLKKNLRLVEKVVGGGGVLRHLEKHRAAVEERDVADESRYQLEPEGPARESINLDRRGRDLGFTLLPFDYLPKFLGELGQDFLQARKWRNSIKYQNCILWHRYCLLRAYLMMIDEYLGEEESVLAIDGSTDMASCFALNGSTSFEALQSYWVRLELLVKKFDTNFVHCVRKTS
ncbi:ATP-dependent caseinolytic (Clp)protease/crotonase family protein [Striga asiatica]|uniref:ATP-dependent caseinolytic (Clp)protease/crotonase family protein n=1 Tax=Striga asiatica TaxID=4170 RepID=A0A5A7RLM0_STRAF|nr:ATP-dependent caseinolytic (Clp)protease/crotonase family protein [Striga asiatica]